MHSFKYWEREEKATACACISRRRIQIQISNTYIWTMRERKTFRSSNFFFFNHISINQHRSRRLIFHKLDDWSFVVLAFILFYFSLNIHSRTHRLFLLYFLHVEINFKKSKKINRTDKRIYRSQHELMVSLFIFLLITI